MYEESKKRLNWVTVALRILLIILLLILSVKVVTIIRKNAIKNSIKEEYDSRLELIDNYAKDYFKDNIPKKSGETNVIYLEELVKDKKIDDIPNCDLKQSYIKVVKLDTEYEVKTYLTCNGYEDSINSFIQLKGITTTTKKPTPVTTTTTSKVTTTSKTTTSRVTQTKKTTKKITTTKAPVSENVRVSFNTNGGYIINDIIVTKNSQINALPIPARDGYRFVGWYYHGSEFDINSVITNDIVLVAKWIEE